MTTRQSAGARTLRDFNLVMQLAEARLAFQLVNFEAADRLTNTRQLFAHLVAGLPDATTESFYILSLNPNRRPICRTRIASGISVTAHVRVRDIILTALLAEARMLACVRLQPEGSIRPTLADGRLLWNLNQATRLMDIQLLDYFIARTTGEYYSCREHGELHE